MNPSSQPSNDAPGTFNSSFTFKRRKPEGSFNGSRMVSPFAMLKAPGPLSVPIDKMNDQHPEMSNRERVSALKFFPRGASPAYNPLSSHGTQHPSLMSNGDAVAHGAHRQQQQDNFSGSHPLQRPRHGHLFVHLPESNSMMAAQQPNAAGRDTTPVPQLLKSESSDESPLLTHLNACLPLADPDGTSSAHVLRLEPEEKESLPILENRTSSVNHFNFPDTMRTPQRNLHSSLVNRGSSLSRGASETPLRGAVGSEEDLSALMMKGATDLRNARLFAEEEKRRCEELKNELVLVTKERDDLKSKILQIKQKTRDGLKASSLCLEDMKETILKLHEESKKYGSFVDIAKSAMAETSELGTKVQISVQSMKSLLGEDGRFLPSHELKAMLQELREGNVNKQQMLDIFRDRLEFAHGDLEETKQRIKSLEASQAEDRTALRLSTTSLSEAGERISALTDSLKRQQEQTQNLAATNARLESKVIGYEKLVETLQTTLSQREKDLREISSIRDEFLTLQCNLEQRNAQIIDYSEQVTSLRESLQQTEAAKAAVVLEKEQLQMKCAQMDALNVRLSELQENLQRQKERICTLKEELQASLRAQHELSEENVRYRTELDSRRGAEESDKRTIRQLHNRLEDCKRVSNQAEVQCRNLQERLEDQAILLREEKKAHGDLQERLLGCETAYVSRIEELKRSSEVEIAKLHEQNASLNAKVKELQATSTNNLVPTDYTSQFEDVKKHNDDLFKESNNQLLEKMQGMLTVMAESEGLRNEAVSLRADLLKCQESRSAVQHHLETTLSELKIEKAASAELSRQLAEANERESQLVLQQSTMVSRFEDGKLNDEEKKFVSAVSRVAGTSQAREFVAKENLIGRMENTIKSLEKRVKELSSQLANTASKETSIDITNHEQTAYTKNTNAKPQQINKRSLIDALSLSSSDVTQDSSPPRAPDSDPPTTLDEAERRPAVVVREHMTTAPSSAKHSDTHNLDVHVHDPSGILTSSTKGNARSADSGTFAKLSRGNSDEIIEFDDEDKAGKGSKKRLHDDITEDGVKGHRALRRNKTAGLSPSVATSKGDDVKTSTSTTNARKQRKRR